jgi:hypothetical protein
VAFIAMLAFVTRANVLLPRATSTALPPAGQRASTAVDVALAIDSAERVAYAATGGRRRAVAVTTDSAPPGHGLGPADALFASPEYDAVQR